MKNQKEQYIKDLLPYFHTMEGMASYTKDIVLLGLAFMKKNVECQQESEGKKIVDNFKGFISNNKGFVLIRNSGERRSLLELGFHISWGGAVYVHLAIGNNSRQKLLEMIVDYVVENNYTICPQNGKIIVYF